MLLWIQFTPTSSQWPSAGFPPPAQEARLLASTLPPAPWLEILDNPPNLSGSQGPPMKKPENWTPLRIKPEKTLIKPKKPDSHTGSYRQNLQTV